MNVMNIDDKDIYRVVLPERYKLKSGRYADTVSSFLKAEEFDEVWVDIRKRAVMKMLRDLDYRGMAELPSDAPKWVLIVRHDNGEELALVSVKYFM